METEKLIPIQEIVTHHDVEISFINALGESGLIEITTVEETQYVFIEQIKDIERMIQLHYELEINIEGIEAISHLLQRVKKLQDELATLKNRLNIYESE